jgi:hypothetical protein
MQYQQTYKNLQKQYREPSAYMMSITRLLITLTGALLLLATAACSGGGAVVFAPTPLPPDISPTRYTHPSGAFRIDVPRTWALQERNTSTLATAAFSPPGATNPLLTIAVVRLPNAPINASGVRALLDAYQNNIRPDLLRYTEQDREAMSDGSWRMTGLRRTTGGTTQAVNTFIEIENNLVGVIDIILPPDAVLTADLTAAINTFFLEDGLNPTELDTLGFASSGRLEALNVHTWSADGGVFFVTGEVANYSDQVYAEVPISVTLQTPDGRAVAEANDLIMGYGLEPGAFAPFSLRFGAGQPPLTEELTLTLGGPDWDPAAVPTVYAEDVLAWTDVATPREEGGLLITGTVTNVSEDVFVYLPRAIVTAFDAQQRVIGAGFSDLDDVEIAPGETSPFSVVLPEVGGEATRTLVRIQGQP